MQQSERIMREVALEYGITLTELRSDDRQRKYAWPRQIAYIRLFDETKLSYPQIARLMGKKDHTTVMHGVKVGRQKIKQGLLEGETDDDTQLQSEGDIFA
jgi:chromosomal replication initiator protein